MTTQWPGLGNMITHDRIYLMITGAGTARRAPELLRALAALDRQVIAVPTPNAAMVVALRELTEAIDALGGGHHVVESYVDTVIGPPVPPGLVLVAPCDFNSLNKLAAGIADNLAMSITADAIGQGWPVVVAPSMNAGLWAHPRTPMSLETLRSWGVICVEPEMVAGVPRLAPTERVIEAVVTHLGAGRSVLR